MFATFLARSEWFVDLGSSRVRIADSSRRIVVDQPSMLLVNEKRGDILPAESDDEIDEGKRVPGLRVFPLVQNGMVTDGEMLSYAIASWKQKMQLEFLDTLISVPIVVGVPLSCTGATAKVITHIWGRHGFRVARVVKLPLAQASFESRKYTGTQMVVDIGAQKVDIAVVSGGKILQSATDWRAGDFVDRLMQRWIKSKYQLEVSPSMVRQLKHNLSRGDSSHILRGKHEHEGRFITVKCSSKDVCQSYAGYPESISALVFDVLSRLDAGVLDEIHQHGILFAGGGALLPTLREAVEHDVGIQTRVLGRNLVSGVLGLAHVSTHDGYV